MPPHVAWWTACRAAAASCCVEKAVLALGGAGLVGASAPIFEVVVYHDAELVTREAICGAIRGAVRSPSW